MECCTSCGNITSLPVPPPTSLRPLSRQSPFSNQGLKAGGRLSIRRAGKSGGNGPMNGNWSFNPPESIFKEEAIGAEYGEGFETFRSDGALKIDVDYLNDRLQEGLLQRIRYAMKPDEAYGLIFSWENVITDVRNLKLSVWKQLAIEEGVDIPEDERTIRLILNGSTSHLLHQVMKCDAEEREVERLKGRISQLYYENLAKVEKPFNGLEKWLRAVSMARIPCAVVSSLDRANMMSALERMNLKQYFQTIISEEDGMESMADRFLSAAVKLDRKPAKCVVFEDDPRGITAAHNCTMMAVALIGAHPAYDLEQADMAVSSFNELSVINLRRLFANKGSKFMDRQKQFVDVSAFPPKRKLTVDNL